MNQLIAIVFLLYSVLPAGAQKKPAIVNLSLTKPEKAILYIGVDNILSVRGEMPGKYFHLERSNGPLELKAGTQLRAILRYETAGRDTFRLYAGDDLIAEKIYEIIPTGNYGAKLDLTNDSVVTKSALIKAKRVVATMPGTYYKPVEKIVLYTITAMQGGRKIKQWKNEGATFSESFATAVSDLPAGTVLHFDGIKISHKTKGLLPVPPFRITLQD